MKSLFLFLSILGVVFIVNGVVGTQYKRTEENEELFKGLQVVVGVLQEITEGAIGEIPGGGSVVAAIKNLYGELSGTKLTVWDQVKDNVEHLTTVISKQALDTDARNKIYELEQRIKMGNLTEEDLDEARLYRTTVFPQFQEDKPWSEDYVVNLVPYTQLLINAYYMRIEQGGIDKCSLGEYLVTYRLDLLAAMKEMIRKYYQLIKLKTYRKIGNAKIVSFRIGSHESAPTFEVLQPEEGKNTRIVSYPANPLARIKIYLKEKFKNFPTAIKDVEKTVVDYLYNAVISKINKFFKQDICLSGCSCPEPIAKTEIFLDWPSNCMDKDNKCAHPCGKGVGYSEYSCLNKTLFGDNSKYLVCEPVDIRCCIALPGDTKGRCDNKKKKKKKKQKKDSKKSKNIKKESE